MYVAQSYHRNHVIEHVIDHVVEHMIDHGIDHVKRCIN